MEKFLANVYVFVFHVAGMYTHIARMYSHSWYV